MNAMKLNPSRWRMSLIGVALCLQLSSCATPPSVRFHTLLTMDSDERVNPSVSEGAGFAVNLTTVTIPAQVDQPQWLVRNIDGSLSLLEQERWVAPLRGELQSALLDRWAKSWGGSSPTSSSKELVWRVSVEVTRWESVPGREVRLESRWTATSGASSSPTLSCQSWIRESVQADSGSLTLALAAGHRRAVARLADEVATRLNGVQKGELPLCAEAKR